MWKNSVKMTSLTEHEMALAALMPLIREQLAAGQNVRMTPYGISMLPMLHPGVDEVVLSPVPARLKKYDLPLYQRDDGKFILHRIVAVGDTYTCCGDNQYALERDVRHDQLIAVVTSFRRNGTVHQMDEGGYRLYCRFWCASRPFRHLLHGVRRRLRRRPG